MTKLTSIQIKQQMLKTAAQVGVKTYARDKAQAELDHANAIYRDLNDDLNAAREEEKANSSRFWFNGVTKLVYPLSSKVEKSIWNDGGWKHVGTRGEVTYWETPRSAIGVMFYATPDTADAVAKDLIQQWTEEQDLGPDPMGDYHGRNE